MTGRYPWGVGYYDMKGPSLSIPLGFKLVSDLLADHASYETHAIGKWNLGHHVYPLTPTRRGFKTFFGYYAAAQSDYWTHGAPPNECGTKGEHDAITDLSNNTIDSIGPANKTGLRGAYNQELFTEEAIRLISSHGRRLRSGELPQDTGFYLYLAYHNVHGAVTDLSQQAPQKTVGLYNTTKLDTYKVAGAMITELDDGVRRILACPPSPSSSSPPPSSLPLQPPSSSPLTVTLTGRPRTHSTQECRHERQLCRGLFFRQRWAARPRHQRPSEGREAHALGWRAPRHRVGVVSPHPGITPRHRMARPRPRL